ncbi:MAG: hypothetical protein VX278_21075, partial [Myxococcota bacterium]|nr:hypothetical protein [Myxococcota bacterium]
MTNQYPIFTQKLQREGFDIVFPFPLSALDDATLANIPSSTIPLHGKCGIIIANTASVWLPFLLWLREQPNWRRMTDPFDTFAEHTINLHCDATFPDAQIYWTHE